MSPPNARAAAQTIPATPERRVATLLGSSIGKKAVMAATGVILVGFVMGHMAGNLQVYLGPEPLNHYGEFLRTLLHGAGIWIARGTLLAAVGLHIWAAASLTIDNRSARPVAYRRRAHTESTYASRTMVWSGPILALFVVYHILHLTIGAAHGSFVEGDVYHNVVAGFQVAPVSAFYIVAMLALGMHLYHGIWSMLQTLGLSHPKWNGLRFAASAGITLIVVAGNISIPVAILVGLVK
jgi:succinate dehydrogenase / fumarate reductase cytochrome b subunit